MKLHVARLFLVVAITVGALSFATAAVAQDQAGARIEEAGGSSFIGGPSWLDVREVTIWSLVCIGAGATVLGVLYLLKKRIGGFPENPAWVAPITIMRSRDLPGDEEEEHGFEDSGHAPAH
ncbi:MAG: hypothetical protein WBO97_04680 [Tepidiformaceae bacterium]